MINNIFSLLKKRSIRNKFSKVYSNNLFRGNESKSGEGSGIAQTQIIRREIPAIIKKLQVKTLLDAPCGDFFWMEQTNLPVNKYIGIDLVEEVINQNKVNYTAPERLFLTKNLLTDQLPQADIILCRDCLVHLSFKDAYNVIKNFKKSGSKYLLTTTFTDRKFNNDLGKGFWRTLNLELSPFNFPQPLVVINENCTEDNCNYTDKSLGLWLLKDIKTELLRC